MITTFLDLGVRVGLWIMGFGIKENGMEYLYQKKENGMEYVEHGRPMDYTHVLSREISMKLPWNFLVTLTFLLAYFDSTKVQKEMGDRNKKISFSLLSSISSQYDQAHLQFFVCHLGVFCLFCLIFGYYMEHNHIL